MKLHRYEKEIVKYVLENTEVRWSQLKEDLVEKGVMAQGTLSKYMGILQRTCIIDKKFDDKGYPVYYVPEASKKEMRELTGASLSPEDYKTFAQKVLDATPDELTEIVKAKWKKREEKIIEEGQKGRFEEQKEKEGIIKRLKKEGKI